MFVDISDINPSEIRTSAVKMLPSLTIVAFFMSVCSDKTIYLEYFFILCRNARERTPKMASLKIPELIFDVPSVRSVNMMETSFILNPSFHAVCFISI